MGRNLIPTGKTPTTAHVLCATLARRKILRKEGWSEMAEFCFVLDSVGNKLSPTNTKKGWYLIRKERAKLVNKFPMVIQLKKEVKEEKIDKTPIVLGIDDGSKHTGIALVQECQTKNKPLFKGTIEHRNDVSHKMDVRRGYRKYRRSQKRYREKRFDNRASSRRKGRFAPSILQKKQATLRVVNHLNKWCRISSISLEDTMFDIRALTDGHKLYRWEYQESNRLDENLRKAVLMRDGFCCQECGASGCKLEVHHIIARRFGGADSVYNLITLCTKCHKKVTGVEEKFVVHFQ